MTIKKTKMTINEEGLSSKIKGDGQVLKVASQFTYLGSIIRERKSRVKIISSAIKTVTAVSKLRNMGKDRNICLK